MSNGKIYKRGLPGLDVTPALKELNEIREHTNHDMSVYDRDTFHEANSYTHKRYVYR